MFARLEVRVWKAEEYALEGCAGEKVWKELHRVCAQASYVLVGGLRGGGGGLGAQGSNPGTGIGGDLGADFEA